MPSKSNSAMSTLFENTGADPREFLIIGVAGQSKQVDTIGAARGGRGGNL